MRCGDRIVFPELDFDARVGILSGESDRPQPLRARIEVELSLAAAGRSDELSESFDYRRIEEIVAAASEGVTGLLETIASRILDGLHEESRVTGASVALHKRRPPLGEAVGPIIVELRRVRGGAS
jgi:dihydroneopterin aldolase